MGGLRRLVRAQTSRVQARDSFADRFAAGNYFHPGTPSEYATAPYTDVARTTYQPGPIPPGVSTPFSADNPGGALGRGGFQGTQAPIMGAGSDDEPSEDTLTARDRAIGQGSGGFYPTPFNPGQFAPSSPFGSGAGVGWCWPSGSDHAAYGNAVLWWRGVWVWRARQHAADRAARLPEARRLSGAWLAPARTSTATRSCKEMRPHMRKARARWAAVIGLGGLDALGQGTVFRGR